MGQILIPYGGPIEPFNIQPVLHDWCNKGHGMYYPVFGTVHIKDPLLLIGKSSLCFGCSRFYLLLSEWSFTIRLTPYSHKQNMFSASLNKTFPSFLFIIFFFKLILAQQRVKRSHLWNTAFTNEVQQEQFHPPE